MLITCRILEFCSRITFVNGCTAHVSNKLYCYDGGVAVIEMIMVFICQDLINSLVFATIFVLGDIKLTLFKQSSVVGTNIPIQVNFYADHFLFMITMCIYFCLVVLYSKVKRFSLEITTL